MDQRWTLEQLTILLEKALETAGCTSQSSGACGLCPMRGPSAITRPSGCWIRRRDARPKGLLPPVAPSAIGGHQATAISGALAGTDPAVARRISPRISRSWPGCHGSSSTPSKKRWPRCGQRLPRRSARKVLPLRGSAGASLTFAPALLGQRAGPRRGEHPTPNRSDRPTAQCALHIQAGDGVELVLLGVDPNRLDRGTSARLQEIVEKVARELNQLPLTSLRSRAERRKVDERRSHENACSTAWKKVRIP